MNYLTVNTNTRPQLAISHRVHTVGKSTRDLPLARVSISVIWAVLPHLMLAPTLNAPPFTTHPRCCFLPWPFSTSLRQIVCHCPLTGTSSTCRPRCLFGPTCCTPPLMLLMSRPVLSWAPTSSHLCCWSTLI